MSNTITHLARADNANLLNHRDTIFSFKKLPAGTPKEPAGMIVSYLDNSLVSSGTAWNRSATRP